MKCTRHRFTKHTAPKNFVINRVGMPQGLGVDIVFFRPPRYGGAKHIKRSNSGLGNMHRRAKVILLGNCVAERLQGILARYPGFHEQFEMVAVPMVHLLQSDAQWHALACRALRCDIIFTQPLFNYGPCNTAALRAAMKEGNGLQSFPRQILRHIFRMRSFCVTRSI